MRYIHILILILLTLTPAVANVLENDNSKAVILAYQHIGEPEHQQTNLSTELFDTHIEEITNGDYNVLPLSQIVDALKSKTPLPPRTIAITFDGVFQSAYDNAIKKLIQNDIPFTLFISSESTEIPSQLDWRTLRKIAKSDNASFGIMPANYEHISQLSKNEAARLINKSRTAFKEHMNTEATLFSYPYGEISNTLLEISKEQGFTAAFGLHSGPAHSASDMLALPRFAMTTQYADIDRFRMITNTAPLPTIDIEPQNWQLSQPLDQIGFTVPQSLEDNISDLSCHVSNQSKPRMEILGNRVEIIPHIPITDERTRLNCTLPVQNDGDEKQWRWLGMLFHTPQDTTPQMDELQ
ncbi:MAG: polysaccharide deacetylase family protein [Alphaproteobacteria bacterium]|nr:polysaccharide deacetylase family protein [Alphaproteobacteria bacterium]